MLKKFWPKEHKTSLFPWRVMVLSLSVQAELTSQNQSKGQVKNSVGAGDSMVAGFTGKLATTGDVIEAFKWGVACGTATTFSDDLATAGLY